MERIPREKRIQDPQFMGQVSREIIGSRETENLPCSEGTSPVGCQGENRGREETENDRKQEGPGSEVIALRAHHRRILAKKRGDGMPTR